MDDFKVGDRVKLKAVNPYKGALKCGEIYLVRYVTYGIIIIKNSLNDSNGCYPGKWFKLVDYDDTATIEYEDAIAAQDIMEHI